MKNTPVQKKIHSKDLELLKNLIKYRILTYEQVKTLQNMTMHYVYKRIEILVKKGLIAVEPITRLRGRQNQGKYVRITDKGLTVLKQNGIELDEKINQYHYKVVNRRVAETILANDVFIELEQNNWEWLDSREVKNKYILNRGGYIMGEIANEELNERLGVFIINHDMKPNFSEYEKFFRETLAVSKFGIYNLLILVRSKEMLQHITADFLNREDSPKSSLLKIRVMEIGTAIRYLEAVLPKQNAFQIFNRMGFNYEIIHNPIYLDEFTQEKRKQFGLEEVIRLKDEQFAGKEYYLVDLLDMDVKKIERLNNVKQEWLEEDNRELLVLTLDSAYLKTLLTTKTKLLFINLEEKYLLEEAEKFSVEQKAKREKERIGF